MFIKAAALVLFFVIVSLISFFAFRLFSPKTVPTPTPSIIPEASILPLPSAQLGLASAIPSNSSNSASPSTSVNPLPSPTPNLEKDGCYRAGCSGEICSDPETMKGFATVCGHDDGGWARIACTRDLKCERQSDGKCGFTETAESKQCMIKAEKDYPYPDY